MIETIEQNYKILEEKKVPVVFLNILHGKKIPKAAEGYCERPRHFYDIVKENPQNFGSILNTIVPLWETNGDSVTAYVLAESPLFIRQYFEDQPNEYTKLGNSYQAFLCYLFIFLWECEKSDSEMIEAANAFNFKYLNNLDKYLWEINGIGYPERDKKIIEFIDKVEATEQGQMF